MGFTGQSSFSGVTPGRQTVVTLDVPSYGLSQPAFWREWVNEEISVQGNETEFHTHYLPKVGWRLLPYTHTLSVTHEQTEDDDSLMALVVPSGFELLKQQRWNSEFTGVPQGSLRTSGDSFYQKTVQAGSSFADPVKSILTADQASYPGPSGGAVPLDRVAIGTRLSTPGDAISGRFKLPGAGGAHAIGTFKRVYFSGVPGSTGTSPDLQGTGQYCMALDGDGWGKLLEKRLSDGDWVSRWTFRWADSTKAAGADVFFSIHSDARLDVNGKWVGSKILFHFYTRGGLVDLVIQTAIVAIDGAQYQTYWIPQKTRGLQPTLIYPRADVRRDVFVMFQLRSARYYPTGLIRTKTFTLPYKPRTHDEGGELLRLQWLGDLPPGTGISAQVFEASSGTALVPDSGPVTGPRGGVQSFRIASRERSYYAEFTLSSDEAQWYTPTLQRVRVVRTPDYTLSTPEPVVPSVVSSLSLMGQDSDPSHESGTITLHDLRSNIDAIKKRARIQSMIEVRYDPEDETKTSTLFRGFLMSSRARRRGSDPVGTGFSGGGDPRLHPNQYWATHFARLSGEWQRLAELQLPQTYSFDRDSDANLLDVDGSGDFPAFKVTEIIYTLLRSVFPDQMLDIPDLPLRYFTDGKAPLVFEMFSPLLPIVSWLARTYLGAYLVYDANATSLPEDDPNRETDKHGCWRLKLPKKLPAVPLVEFHSSPPFTGRRVTNTNSYHDTEDEETNQVIKHTFIRKGTYYERVVPPEANLIVVTGVGVPASQEVHSLSAVTSQTEIQLGPYVAFNYKSAWLYPDQPTPPATDPEDPDYCDYLGDVVPLYYCDPGLTTEAACLFTLRRLYDMTAHARKIVVFEAPLVLVTDILDTKQTRPRPLVYGDPVLVDGIPYFVGSPAIDYGVQKGGDRYQMAAYELFSTPPMLGESIPLVSNQAITPSRID